MDRAVVKCEEYVKKGDHLGLTRVVAASFGPNGYQHGAGNDARMGDEQEQERERAREQERERAKEGGRTRERERGGIKKAEMNSWTVLAFTASSLPLGLRA